MKSNSTANAVETAPRGMALDMESLSTSLLSGEAAPIRSQTASGDAGARRDATPGEITQARSGAQVSDAERLKLARIRRNRNQGWMASFGGED